MSASDKDAAPRERIGTSILTRAYPASKSFKNGNFQ
jgi:hypothetical protein